MIFGRKKRKIENMSLLTSVQTDTQACVIQGLLDSCGIYSYLDYDNLGGSLKVVIGNSKLGVNIYVKNDELEEARQILNSREFQEDDRNRLSEE